MTRLSYPEPDPDWRAHRDVLLAELDAYEASRRRVKRLVRVGKPAPVQVPWQLVNLKDLELLLVELHVLSRAVGRVNGGAPRMVHRDTEDAIRRLRRAAGVGTTGSSSLP